MVHEQVMNLIASHMHQVHLPALDQSFMQGLQNRRLNRQALYKSAAWIKWWRSNNIESCGFWLPVWENTNTVMKWEKYVEYRYKWRKTKAQEGYPLIFCLYDFNLYSFVYIFWIHHLMCKKLNKWSQSLISRVFSSAGINKFWIMIRCHIPWKI